MSLCVYQISEKMTEKAAQSGVKFIATGKSVMSTVQGSGMNSPGFIVNFPLALASESKTLITFLDAYINEENKVDIIIGEEFVVAALYSMCHPEVPTSHCRHVVNTSAYAVHLSILAMAWSHSWSDFRRLNLFTEVVEYVWKYDGFVIVQLLPCST